MTAESNAPNAIEKLDLTKPIEERVVADRLHRSVRFVGFSAPLSPKGTGDRTTARTLASHLPQGP